MKQKIQCVNEKRGDSEKNYEDQHIFGQTNQRKQSESKLIKFAMTGKAEHYNRQEFNESLRTYF